MLGFANHLRLLLGDVGRCLDDRSTLVYSVPFLLEGDPHQAMFWHPGSDTEQKVEASQIEELGRTMRAVAARTIRWQQMALDHRAKQ